MPSQKAWITFVKSDRSQGVRTVYNRVITPLSLVCRLARCLCTCSYRFTSSMLRSCSQNIMCCTSPGCQGIPIHMLPSKVSPNHGKQRSNNKTLLQTVLVFLHRTRQNGVHCGALGCRWITSRAHRQPLHFEIYKSTCNNTDRDALAARCSCPSKLLSHKQLLLLLLRAVAGFPVQSFVTDTQSEHVTTSLQLRATSNGLEVSFGQAPARCSCCRDAPRALHVGHAGGEEHLQQHMNRSRGAQQGSMLKRWIKAHAWSHTHSM